QMTAITTICTIDIPIASPAWDQAPSPTMCSAYSAAETSVIAAPNEIVKPLKVSTASPATASSTASQVTGVIRCRSSTAANSGVSTTYIPVTKPDTEAAVWARPMVCRICATPYNPPSTTA